MRRLEAVPARRRLVAAVVVASPQEPRLAEAATRPEEPPVAAPAATRPVEPLVEAAVASPLAEPVAAGAANHPGWRFPATLQEGK